MSDFYPCFLGGNIPESTQKLFFGETFVGFMLIPNLIPIHIHFVYIWWVLWPPVWVKESDRTKKNGSLKKVLQEMCPFNMELPIWKFSNWLKKLQEQLVLAWNCYRILNCSIENSQPSENFSVHGTWPFRTILYRQCRLIGIFCG